MAPEATELGTDASGGGDACVRALPTCPPSPPGWSAMVQTIVEDRCVVCHHPGGADTTRDYTSYARVYAERGSVLNQVFACAMPPPGATPLAAAERTKLMTWLVCGAPDD